MALRLKAEQTPLELIEKKEVTSLNNAFDTNESSKNDIVTKALLDYLYGSTQNDDAKQMCLYLGGKIDELKNQFLFLHQYDEISQDKLYFIDLYLSTIKNTILQEILNELSDKE